MKHLIIVAHPNPESLTRTLADTYAAELRAMGHEADVRDLYAQGFDPVLRRTELGGKGKSDVQAEQALLKTAAATAFFYPLWWASMPAILKGYIDRVFSHGFAYEFGAGGMHGLLTGKTNLLVTLSAAPTEILEKSGELGAIRAIQDAHIFRSVGLTLAEHLHFGDIAPGVSESTVQNHIWAVRGAAHRHFPPVLHRTA